MSKEPPHTPDENDHLIDLLEDDDHVTDNLAFFAAREEKAFANELASLRPVGIRVATPIVHTLQEAEDAVNETIARLFARGRPGTPLTPLFITCVKHAATDRVRSAAWRKSQDDAVLAAVASPDETPFERYLRNERVDVIREFLRQLCSEDREILRLRYYVGMTLEEMALHFNAPLNTVYSRLKRAENRLVKLLKKGGKFNV